MSKPIECTSSRENPDVNHGLGVQNVDREGGCAYVATQFSIFSALLLLI